MTIKQWKNLQHYNNSRQFDVQDSVDTVVFVVIMVFFLIGLVVVV